MVKKKINQSFSVFLISPLNILKGRNKVSTELSSPGWTTTTLPTFPHKSGVSALWLFLWCSSGESLNKSMSFLYRGPQNQMQFSPGVRQGVLWEPREWITSLTCWSCSFYFTLRLFIKAWNRNVTSCMFLNQSKLEMEEWPHWLFFINTLFTSSICSFSQNCFMLWSEVWQFMSMPCTTTCKTTYLFKIGKPQPPSFKTTLLRLHVVHR